MKICAVICEYNPFHNGHLHQLAEIGKQSDHGKLLCVMSGNFTQRGEAAVFDKYTRARHAVLAGADAVVELPAAFAVSPAELFAEGAVHILSSIPAVATLAFGCESGTKEDFLAAARASLREDKAFRTQLKERMKDGTSYPKARTETLLALNSDVDEALFTSPNNLLGTEYTRAILERGAAIEPLPLLRVGGGYADRELKKNFSSATALRAVLGDGSMKVRRVLKSNLPDMVYADALRYRPIPYDEAALCALLTADADAVSKTPDCSEGLENRMRSMARVNPTAEGMLEKVVSKRYTRSRVKRILLQNFLGVELKAVKSFLASPLYLRVLAVKKEGAEETLSALSQSKFPLVARKSDSFALKKTALECFSLDLRANDLYGALIGRKLPDYELLFV